MKSPRGRKCSNSGWIPSPTRWHGWRARVAKVRDTHRVCKPGKKSLAFRVHLSVSLCHCHYFIYFFPTPFELPHFHARESLVVKIHAC